MLTPQENNEDEEDMNEGEQGESEPCSPVDDDELEDMDLENADAKTMATAQMRINPSLCSVPTLAAGSLQALQKAPGKKAKARSKRTLSVEDQIEEAEKETWDDAETEIMSEADLPEWIKNDSVLRQVCLKMGRIYNCMSSLIPEENLRMRKPVGRQLTGAGFDQNMTEVLSLKI